jgi:hypothetical protein
MYIKSGIARHGTRPHAVLHRRYGSVAAPAGPSTHALNLGIWILSHIDLRSSARVRVAREFLIESIEGQREVVLGEGSRYYEAAAGC